jgi:hypothetical protein
MKGYGGVDVQIHIFLTSALVGRLSGQLQAPPTERFGETQSRSGRGENSSYRDSNSGPSVVQPVASRYIDYAIPAMVHLLKKHL